jgi:hypothetical protein
VSGLATALAEHAHHQHHQGAGQGIGDDGRRAGCGDGVPGADEQPAPITPAIDSMVTCLGLKPCASWPLACPALGLLILIPS